MIVQKRPWQERYTDYFYRNQKNWIDGTRQFHEMIQKYLSKDKVVLELGPGIKNRTSSFLRGICAALDGLDVDENAKENPDLRHIYIYGGGDWPIADNSYDAVISDYVFEHIEKPEKITAEAFRVLRPGGLLFFRTPNLWHYIYLVAFLTPHWFHKLVANRLRRLPPDASDPFPTFYRMNRCRTLRALMRDAGFKEVELVMIEKDPSYGKISRILFLLFMAYERFVNSSNLFSMFRANILGVFVKPEVLPKG